MQLPSHPIAPDLGAESEVVAFDKYDFSFQLKAGTRLVNSISNFFFTTNTKQIGDNKWEFQGKYIVNVRFLKNIENI
jgi:hypothetical protein